MQVRCVIFTSIYLKLHFGWLSTYDDKLFLKFYSKTLKLRTVMQFVQNKDDVSEILFLLTGFQWQTHWWSYTRQSIIKQFHFKHWTVSTNYFRLVSGKGVKRLSTPTQPPFPMHLKILNLRFKFERPVSSWLAHAVQRPAWKQNLAIASEADFEIQNFGAIYLFSTKFTVLQNFLLL